MSGEELRALAEAATPGPWESRYEACAWELTKPCEISPGNYGHPLNILKANSGRHDWPPTPEDAAFIAAANPTAVLALLDERDALRAQIERVRALADEWEHTDWNARPHLGCLDMRRYCAGVIHGALDGPQ